MPRYNKTTRRRNNGKHCNVTVTLPENYKLLANNIANTYFAGSLSGLVRGAISEMGMNLGIWRRTDRRKILMDGGCVAVDRLEQRLKRHGWSEQSPDYEI